MFITVIITLVILFFSYKKPIYGIVFVLNMNSIRALPELDLNNFSFRSTNDGDLYFSVLLPLVVYSMIILKRDYSKKRVLYFFDYTDLFFSASIIVMGLYSFVSPNFMEGVEYTFKYLLIGMPFYYISKIVLLNSEDFKKDYILFFKSIIVASILVGSLGLILAYSVDFIEPSFPKEFKIPIARLTIPGVYPIPFSQTIGFGSLILFSVIYTKGVTLRTDRNKHILFCFVLFFYTIFLILLSNTRGVLISLIVAIMFFIKIHPRKISKKMARFFLIFLLIAVIVIFNFIDFSNLFARLLNSFNNDASANQRIEMLVDAIRIVLTNPIGVGTYGFIHGYTHNIFLDYIVYFGVFGWFLSFALIGIIVYFYSVTYRLKKDPIVILLYCFIIYFFVETMISFTLWMHKGMYLSIGLFVSYNYLIKKEKNLETS